MSTAEKTPAADPFADLFAAAAVEPVRTKKSDQTRYDGPIPDGLITLVKTAAENGQRVVIPCTDLKVYDDILAMARTVVDKEAPGKVVYGTARHDDAKNLTHVTFTVGAKRGKRSAAETAAAEEAPKETPAETPAETAAEEASKETGGKAPASAGPQNARKTAGAQNK